MGLKMKWITRDHLIFLHYLTKLNFGDLMNKFSILTVIFISLLLSSCSTDTPVSPKEAEQGGISLNIDRMHKPDNVVSVTAYLSREGYDTLSGTLNLLSDTTADITFSNLAAGGWHLKVDASDEESVVVYTGETDVNILAGITTQVYLTLEPTGAGVGNIYIFVNWGIPPNTNWIDYPYNPILQPQLNGFDNNGITQPKIIEDGTVYKMWYVAEAGGYIKYIMYAESPDGINWNRPINHPVMYPGISGSWDDMAVHPGAIFKEDGIYKMYYSGWSDPWGQWNIGYATSTDGINWTKYPVPVLYGTSGWEFQIAPSAIIKIDNTYYLYYTGRNLPNYKIGLATSTDGINWNRYESNPVLEASQPWEGSGVFHPSIIQEDNIYKMVFCGESGSGFGFATSNDAKNWTKSEQNPFFIKGQTTNEWGNFRITYPFLLKTTEEYRVYYTGWTSNTLPSIGFTRKSF
jgi:predicted GH43/DUF377 family glycosyl hydrolase